MEREVSEVDRKLFLRKTYLDKIHYYINRNPINQDELYLFVRKFFGEYLKLDYEFTYEELSQELNKVFITPKVKEHIDDFLIRLSESEYLEETNLGTNEINAYLGEFEDIIRNIIYDDRPVHEDESLMQKMLKKHKEPAKVMDVAGISSLIEEVNFHITNEHLEIAKISYVNLLKAFDALSKEDKKKLHEDMNEVYARLQTLIKNPKSQIANSQSNMSKTGASSTDRISDAVKKVYSYVDETLFYINASNFESSKKSYAETLRLYESLNPDDKTVAHSRVSELYTQLQAMLSRPKSISAEPALILKSDEDKVRSDRHNENVDTSINSSSSGVASAFSSSDALASSNPESASKSGIISIDDFSSAIQNSTIQENSHAEDNFAMDMISADGIGSTSGNSENDSNTGNVGNFLFTANANSDDKIESSISSINSKTSSKVSSKISSQESILSKESLASEILSKQESKSEPKQESFATPSIPLEPVSNGESSFDVFGRSVADTKHGLASGASGKSVDVKDIKSDSNTIDTNIVLRIDKLLDLNSSKPSAKSSSSSPASSSSNETSLSKSLPTSKVVLEEKTLSKKVDKKMEKEFKKPLINQSVIQPITPPLSNTQPLNNLTSTHMASQVNNSVTSKQKLQSLTSPTTHPVVDKLNRLLKKIDDDIILEKFDNAKSTYKDALLCYREMTDENKAKCYEHFYATFKKLDDGLHQKSLNDILDMHLSESESSHRPISAKGTEIESRNKLQNNVARDNFQSEGNSDYEFMKASRMTTLPIILSNDPETTRVYELIEESYFNIDNSHSDLAMLKYFKALELYHKLPVIDKRKLYSGLYDLFKKLSSVRTI